MPSRTPTKLLPTAPVRLFNTATRNMRKQMVSFEPRSLQRWAEIATGLDDWGDDDGFDLRLEHNLSALDQAGLNTVGRIGARYVLHWKLANRLRRIEARKQHPDLDEIAIEKPIVILGWYRTGTTFLHHVLAADPRNRAAKAWELAYPYGNRRDILGMRPRRRRWGERVFGVNHIAIPEQSDAHHVTADSYEECFFLLENDLAMITFFNAFGTWDYAVEVLDRDMVTPYRAHKQQLQALTAQRRAERWVLKCPWHLWNLDALLAVYPDARIVHTHRDVSKALASHCSLSARMTAKFVDSLDMSALGAFWTDYFKLGLERGLDARSRAHPDQVYDLRLSDLIAEPVETLQKLYAHFELPIDAQLEDRFLRRIAQQPTGRLGEHEYRIDEFGLTRDEVRSRFAEYNERFGV